MHAHRLSRGGTQNSRACRFSNCVSSCDVLTCGDVTCLTSCHLAFVSDSCHFSERARGGPSHLDRLSLPCHLHGLLVTSRDGQLGHWAGDLIIGKNQASQIGTLVERSTGFVQLLHLPARHDPETVAEAMIATIKTLPDALRRSLPWDQGTEMNQHARISIEAGIAIYFCDPRSPWQRGSNENTNGLLRQYFPKGTDLSVHSVEYLAEVASELNERPRKRFDWDSPAQVLNRLLSPPTETTVATKP